MSDPRRSLSPQRLSLCASLGTATMHEACSQSVVLDGRIAPIVSGARMAGYALPVVAGPGDNLAIHRALVAARPGDVLVVNVGGARQFGYFGELMARFAVRQGIAGLVIDGCVRDVEQVREQDFPVFATGRCVRGTAKSDAGSMPDLVRVGGADVAADALVVGDEDGVVVVPRALLDPTLESASQHERLERRIRRRIDAGDSLLELVESAPRP